MIVFLFGLLTACSSNAPNSSPDASNSSLKPSPKSYVPASDSIGASVVPTIFLAQTWFDKQSKKPGPARIEMWRKESEEWMRFRVEDSDSNTFHKLILLEKERGFLTIGATKAVLKKWRFDGNKWSNTVLFEKSWKDKGGKFDRFRDLEIGDVDGDQKNEYILATHDYGEIIVLHPDEEYRQDVLYEKADTFVHEIELGDTDGNGLMEIYATPSDRNTSKRSQKGDIVRFEWNGSQFSSMTVDSIKETHAKEILVADTDGDGKAELFGVIEAQKKDGKVISPIEIRAYSQHEGAEFKHRVIATIDDDQMRFLLSGDFDHDGRLDLVAAARHQGLFLLTQDSSKEWKTTLIDSKSGGFEHACYGADLDLDGKLEIYVASDTHGQLNKYAYNATQKSFSKEAIGSYEEGKIFTWNVMVGMF